MWSYCRKLRMASRNKREILPVIYQKSNMKTSVRSERIENGRVYTERRDNSVCKQVMVANVRITRSGWVGTLMTDVERRARGMETRMQINKGCESSEDSK